MLGLKVVAVLIGVAREGLSDVAFEKRSEEDEESEPWECWGEKHSRLGEQPVQKPEAGECLYACSTVRGQ